MEKAYLYIVLTRTNSIVSRLIYLVTRDEYTHAALSLDKDLKEMYSFGRKYSYYPFLGRFRHEKLDEGLYKRSRRLPGIVLELEVAKESYVQAQRIVQEFIDHSLRYKYNCRGLVFGLINKPTTRSDRFLCSQFVYHVLHGAGIADFGVPENLVKPVDFLKLPARVVYQGDLKRLLPNPKSAPGQKSFVHRLLPKCFARRTG